MKKVLIIFFVFFISILLYMYFIGNSFLNIKEYEFKAINENFKDLKIVQFSDINYPFIIDMNKIRNVVNKINYLNPDIVIFNGNLLNDKINKNQKETLINELKNIKAKYAKFYVPGDKDGDTSHFILNKANFKEITNEEIYDIKSNKITLSNIKNVSKSTDILVTHSPDNYKDFKSYTNIKLVLSGKSLGGLIRLPYLPCLIKFTGAKTYCKDLEKEKDTNILVSSGIGNNKLPFRFFNHPSINLIRFK